MVDSEDDDEEATRVLMSRGKLNISSYLLLQPFIMQSLCESSVTAMVQQRRVALCRERNAAVTQSICGGGDVLWNQAALDVEWGDIRSYGTQHAVGLVDLVELIACGVHPAHARRISQFNFERSVEEMHGPSSQTGTNANKIRRRVTKQMYSRYQSHLVCSGRIDALYGRISTCYSVSDPVRANVENPSPLEGLHGGRSTFSVDSVCGTWMDPTAEQGHIRLLFVPLLCVEQWVNTAERSGKAVSGGALAVIEDILKSGEEVILGAGEKRANLRTRLGKLTRKGVEEEVKVAGGGLVGGGLVGGQDVGLLGRMLAVGDLDGAAGLMAVWEQQMQKCREWLKKDLDYVASELQPIQQPDKGYRMSAHSRQYVVWAAVLGKVIRDQEMVHRAELVYNLRLIAKHVHDDIDHSTLSLFRRRSVDVCVSVCVGQLDELVAESALGAIAVQLETMYTARILVEQTLRRPNRGVETDMMYVLGRLWEHSDAIGF